MGPKQADSQNADRALVETILEAAVDGIVFLKDSAAIDYVNRAGRELLRCARQDDPLPTFNELTKILGFNPLEVTLQISQSQRILETRERGEVSWDTVERRGSPRLFWEQETTLYGVPYLVRGIRLASTALSISGMLLFFTDMREMQRREQIIAENLSFACHEMRTPLTAMKNALDLLGGKRLGELSDEQLRFLKLASRNAERLDIVVTSLLDLGRLETRTLELNLQEINVVEPLKRVLATLDELAQEKEITVQTELQETYPQLHADADRLGQAVYNLVQNAIKFTPERGVIQVSLEMFPHANLNDWLPSDAAIQLPEQLPERWLLLTVADNGEGIPDRYMKSIFAKFVQAGDSPTDPRKRGRGLGLSIVKAVAEAHGGLVWAESELGMGSRFRVLLPELSRETHFVCSVATILERVKAMGSSLSLAIMEVVPETPASVSASQPQEAMLELLNQVAKVTRNTMRHQSDRVEILDPSSGLLALLMEAKREDVPASINRITVNLRRQAEKEGRALHLRLRWGMASYPTDVNTATELVAAAKEAVLGSQAEAVHFG
jgi:signal transduction histidine kinase